MIDDLQESDATPEDTRSIVKQITAYQTGDGRKFFEESEAQNHEDRLKYKANRRKIENYLLNLLGIENLGIDEYEDGESPEEQLSTMIEREGISGLWEDALELEVVVELIIDIATILDGALLKTAQHARRITVGL